MQGPRVDPQNYKKQSKSKQKKQTNKKEKQNQTPIDRR
jgi:hypothetical protein